MNIEQINELVKITGILIDSSNKLCILFKSIERDEENFEALTQIIKATKMIVQKTIDKENVKELIKNIGK